MTGQVNYKPGISLLAFVLLIISNTSFCQVNKKSDTLTKNTPVINVLLNGIKFDTLSLSNMEELDRSFGEVTFRTVNIYFSGSGFPHTQAISVSGKLIIAQGFLKTYFDKFKPGSRITFEKGVLVTAGGKVIAPYNKSIYFR